MKPTRYKIIHTEGDEFSYYVVGNAVGDWGIRRVYDRGDHWRPAIVVDDRKMGHRLIATRSPEVLARLVPLLTKVGVDEAIAQKSPASRELFRIARSVRPDTELVRSEGLLGFKQMSAPLIGCPSLGAAIAITRKRDAA